MCFRGLLCAFVAFNLLIGLITLTSCEEKRYHEPIGQNVDASSSVDASKDKLTTDQQDESDYMINSFESTWQNVDFASSADILNEILTKEQQTALKSKINDIDFISFPLKSQIEYLGNVDNMDSLSEIGIKGSPVLIAESIKKEQNAIEFSDNEEACFQAFVVCAICRVEFYDLPVSRDAMFPSKHFYVRWKRASEELPKIFSSNIENDERLKKYREFGIFALPYVNEEIKNGNKEMERFYSLIGAHISTAEYLKLTEISNENIHPPTSSEADKILLDGAEDFDYKAWLSENEEDLNNLFKFLDAYCAEYEAEQNTK